MFSYFIHLLNARAASLLDGWTAVVSSTSTRSLLAPSMPISTRHLHLHLLNDSNDRNDSNINNNNNDNNYNGNIDDNNNNSSNNNNDNNNNNNNNDNSNNDKNNKNKNENINIVLKHYSEKKEIEKIECYDKTDDSLLFLENKNKNKSDVEILEKSSTNIFHEISAINNDKISFLNKKKIGRAHV